MSHFFHESHMLPEMLTVTMEALWQSAASNQKPISLPMQVNWESQNTQLAHNFPMIMPITFLCYWPFSFSRISPSYIDNITNNITRFGTNTSSTIGLKFTWFLALPVILPFLPIATTLHVKIAVELCSWAHWFCQVTHSFLLSPSIYHSNKHTKIVREMNWILI